MLCFPPRGNNKLTRFEAKAIFVPIYAESEGAKNGRKSHGLQTELATDGTQIKHGIFYFGLRNADCGIRKPQAETRADGGYDTVMRNGEWGMKPDPLPPIQDEGPRYGNWIRR